MSQNKPIQRSIRMTEEVASYIDSYCGSGFSDKLENLVLDSLMGETQRVKRLKDLDDQIKRAGDRLVELSKDYEVFSRIRRDAMYMERQFGSLADQVKARVSQTGAAAPGDSD